MRRSVSLASDDMRRVIVIARREGVTPSAVIRGLVERGLADYESENGPLAIEGVPARTWATSPPHKRPATHEAAMAAV
jgi:hypothetical protein